METRYICVPPGDRLNQEIFALVKGKGQSGHFGQFALEESKF